MKTIITNVKPMQFGSYVVILLIFGIFYAQFYKSPQIKYECLCKTSSTARTTPENSTLVKMNSTKQM